MYEENYEVEYEEELSYLSQASSEIKDHYKQAKKGDIVKKVWQDILQVQIKTNLPISWCFMLY